MATPPQLYVSPYCIVDTTTDEVIVNADLQGRTLEVGAFDALLGTWNR